MTIQRHEPGSSLARGLRFAAPLTLLLLAACGSGESASPATPSSDATSPSTSKVAPPAAAEAPKAPDAALGTAKTAAPLTADERQTLAARTQVSAEDAAHDPNDGGDHTGHDHAHDHTKPDEAWIAKAQEVLDQAVRAHTSAVEAKAPQSQQDALAAKVTLAQEALSVAKGQPSVFGTREGSRLVCPIGQERHDFGRLLQGAVADHDFVLQTEGTEDLIIHQVKPTCGCTVARVLVADAEGAMQEYTYGNPIPPGRKIIVPAALHTKGRSGRQNTSINIASSDPRGSTQLALQADIDPFFNVAPQFLNFGQIEVGEIKTLEATISSARGLPVALSVAPETLPPGLKAELQGVNADAEGKSSQWKLMVTVGPDLMEGTMARAILVTSDQLVEGAEPDHTGKPLHYDISITVSARVVGPFTTNPPYISMGLVRPGQAKNFVVRIDCNDTSFDMAAANLTATVVGVPPQGTTAYPEWEYAHLFTPTFLPVEGQPNSIDVDLALEGMPEEANGSFRGVLLIEMGHSEKPSIPLTITGVCRGGPR